jgi:hypothetical protein
MVNAMLSPWIFIKLLLWGVCVINQLTAKGKRKRRRRSSDVCKDGEMTASNSEPLNGCCKQGFGVYSGATDVF